MTGIKTFKIEQKFNEVDELYSFLSKNVNMINELTGLQIQNSLKYKGYCFTAKEMITERNIILFASKSDFVERLGELIVLSAAFDSDIIIFFMPSASRAYIESINWLQKISNTNTQFIVGEVAI